MSRLIGSNSEIRSPERSTRCRASKRGLLVGDVDQDRARRAMSTEVSAMGARLSARARTNCARASPACSPAASRARSSSACETSEKITRPCAPTLERRARDQPVARPDVEHGRALERLGAREHAAAEDLEMIEHDPALELVAGIAALEQPARPAIGPRFHPNQLSKPRGRGRRRGGL
jgi:hypothetical protein